MSSNYDNHSDDPPTYVWWMPEQAVRDLAFERQLHPDESYKELADRLFNENLPMAALNIIHTSQNDMDSSMRFKASQYIVDRKLGPAARALDLSDDEKAPWEKVYEAVLTDLT